MKKIRYLLLVLPASLVVLIAVLSTGASATGQWAAVSGQPCGTCHIDPSNPSANNLTATGIAFRDGGHVWPIPAASTTTTTQAPTTTTSTTQAPSTTTSTTQAPPSTTSTTQTNTGTTLADDSSDEADDEADDESDDESDKSYEHESEREHTSSTMHDEERRSSEHESYRTMSPRETERS